jgi:hypothetical protein
MCRCSTEERGDCGGLEKTPAAAVVPAAAAAADAAAADAAAADAAEARRGGSGEAVGVAAAVALLGAGCGTPPRLREAWGDCMEARGDWIEARPAISPVRRSGATRPEAPPYISGYISPTV